MSREIKFRAWDNERKQMNYKVCIGNTDEEDKNHTCSTILIGGKWAHFDKYNDIIIEQYTGLKDMNDVEIYEGDIVRVEIDLSEVGSGILRYNSAIEKSVVYLVDLFTSLSNGASLEVIGNIHENPKLVETVNE